MCSASKVFANILFSRSTSPWWKLGTAQSTLHLQKQAMLDGIIDAPAGLRERRLRVRLARKGWTHD